MKTFGIIKTFGTIIMKTFALNDKLCIETMNEDFES